MPVKPFEFFRNLEKMLPQIEREITAQIVAVEAENFVADNFRKEGFTDVAFQKWPSRKKGDDSKKGKRALLVDSGSLRRAATKGRVRGNQVEFVIPLPYASVHNNGERAGRGAGFQMPQRKFIGESEHLERRIEDKARRVLDKRLKNLAD